MAAIEIARVVKNYGAVPVLKNIDLVVPEGGFVVLVGPSGCGKSTLLRMIAGLESVTSGDIRIGDRRVNDLPPRERDVAMVFQDYALYPHKTVADNIGFGLRMRGADKATVERKVRDAAQILRIEHLLDRKPGQLSGGQRQRVAMGRAIVREPKVFLFDEPLSNLDAQLRGEMRIEIKKLYQRFGITTVYVTHDQVEAMTLAEKIAIMRGGELEQYATPDEIYNRPASVFVGGFIGAPRMNFLAATVAADGGSVTLDGLAPIPVPENAPLRAAAGRKVTLGLRPEHVVLGGPVQAEVVLVEPLGSDLNALLQIAGQEAAGRFAPDSKLQAGQGVSLSLRLERARAFDPQSGLAI